MKNYKDLLQDAESLFRDVKDSAVSDDSSSNGKVIAAAVIGLAAGAILGILLAPSSGQETRSAISDSVNNMAGTVKDKARQGYDKLGDLKNQAVDAVKSKVGSNGTTADADTV
ncbi:YtxH domain-containing protein [Pedobacter sp. SYSU D00535]|uniref:YtxH domain-containing protein n=1 Tax=Pedobacter sp. SYSU D00535 TaxID=2810308 RepID=UPI001A96C5DB|nr:YtxH domain-containing protein [Pedobacter sp. SYSU D00535]